MARKVTICSLQWGDLPLAKVCETMAGLGYDGLELGLVGDAAADRLLERPLREPWKLY